MGLKEQINNDIKEAMKSKDKVRLETVRSIKSLILKFETSGQGSLKPENELQLLTGAAKSRKESIEQYEKGNRLDLAEAEKAELAIIESYLPKQLSPEDLFLEVKSLAESIGASGSSDFSKLMPLAAKSLKGRADGKDVRAAVEKYLGAN